MYKSTFIPYNNLSESHRQINAATAGVNELQRVKLSVKSGVNPLALESGFSHGGSKVHACLRVVCGCWRINAVGVVMPYYVAF